MPSPELNPGTRGHIIPIGGAEDKVSDRAILRRFVDLCGGSAARIAVIPTASTLDTTGGRYREVFGSLGVAEVNVLDFRDRGDVERLIWEEALDSATGVFLTGGNQLRLSTILGGTAVATRLRRVNAKGVHVAGATVVVDEDPRRHGGNAADAQFPKPRARPSSPST